MGFKTPYAILSNIPICTLWSFFLKDQLQHNILYTFQLYYSPFTEEIKAHLIILKKWKQ